MARRLDDATQLIARRHAEDRRREPALPDLGDAQLRGGLELSLALPGAHGVLALDNGRPCGLLCGVPELRDPADSAAPFYSPRSVRVPYGAQAVDATAGDALYRALYAALAAGWAREGWLAHYIQLPAGDVAALATWHALGFGLDMGLAVRDTRPLAAPRPAADVQIRRATAADSPVIWVLERELARHEAAAPVFMPVVPASEPTARAELDMSLADPTTICWLAERAGQPLGSLTCVPPPPHIAPLLTPDGTLNIAVCAVMPAERGAGVGTALLAHALTHARAAGYDWLRLTWMTANPLSSRFWSGHGFRPIMYRLVRRVDERAG
jgi:ribosomal protein S18 acetylase RimI-like enzyme